MVTLLYQTLQLTLGPRYGNSAHMGDSCRQQLCIQNCDQTAADAVHVYGLLL